MPIKTKRTKPRRKIWLTLVNIFIITLILSVVLTAGVIFTIVKGAVDKMPEMDLAHIELDESPTIYDANGGILAQDLTEHYRRSVAYDEISPQMVNAIVAIEDKTFWEHEGFNYVRLIGAIRESMMSDDGPSATSTITQQLARNVFLSSDRSMIRKIQEAYIATKLEDIYTKEEIMTHYLNTISFGSNSEGIEAASERYFSKNASELDYVESAMLASIPQAPSQLSPMITLYRSDWDGQSKIVGQKGADLIYIYNPAIENRYALVLNQMLNLGYIDQAQYDAGLAEDLSARIHVGKDENTEFTSYGPDMIATQVIQDLQEEYQIPYADAAKRFYTTGMNVYSTFDPEMQKTVEGVIKESGDMTLFSDIISELVARYQERYGLEITGTMTDGTWEHMIEKGYFEPDVTRTGWQIGSRDGMIMRLKEALATEGLYIGYSPIPALTVEFENGIIMSDREEYKQFAASNYLDFFDADKNATIPPDYYSVDEAGNVILPPSYALVFGEADGGIWVDFQPLYDFYGNTPYNGYWGNVVLDYLLIYRDIKLSLPTDQMEIVDGNLVLKAAMLQDEASIHLTDSGLWIPSHAITRPNAPVIQPQIAIAVTDPYTGYLRAVVGGRGVTGNQLYNRATSPQQPGSAIKPLAVYGPALESRRFTAATVVDDTPTWRFDPSSSDYWPRNYYDAYFGFYGRMSSREGLVQSTNIVATKLGNMVGIDYMTEMLEKNGITTLVKEGAVNDMNLSALTLGGMTYGIPPVEMASAFATFANQGEYIPYKTYSKVTDNQGNIILDNTNPKGEQIYSPEASWILIDMLRENVDRGIGTGARMTDDNRGISTAGKTGTTSNSFDQSFAGVSPYLACSVWMGTDIYVTLNGSSEQSAVIFGDVMRALHAGYENREFFEKPEGVIQVQVDNVSGLLPGPLSNSDPRGPQLRYEWFIAGTEPTELDDAHVSVEVCQDSGKLVAAYCKNTVKRSFITRVDDENLRGNEDRISDNRYAAPTATCDLHTKPPKPETTESDKEETPTEPGDTTEPSEPTEPETP